MPSLTAQGGPIAPVAMTLATLLEDDGFLLCRYIKAGREGTA
jgi:hypothetical protein